MYYIVDMTWGHKKLLEIIEIMLKMSTKKWLLGTFADNPQIRSYWIGHKLGHTGAHHSNELHQVSSDGGGNDGKTSCNGAASVAQVLIVAAMDVGLVARSWIRLFITEERKVITIGDVF